MDWVFIRAFLVIVGSFAAATLVACVLEWCESKDWWGLWG